MCRSITEKRKIIHIDRENVGEATKGMPFLFRIVLSRLVGLKYGSLSIQIPDGRMVQITGTDSGANALLELKSSDLLKRVLESGDVGVGESYMDGEWTSPNVTDVLLLFCQNQQLLLGSNRSGISQMVLKFIQWYNRNTIAGSKRNISAHYDLGNSFYKKWLDPTMTYSSAVFPNSSDSLCTPATRPMDSDLEMAQKAKYQSLIDRTNIGANDHVLEIGCGWGGFAEYAAKTTGCKVTGLTISQEQFDFATKRMAKAGISDQVQIVFRDYRDERDTMYDSIVSIEMFEAVGEEYWPTYFDCLNHCLKPGRRAGIQVIAIQDHLFDRYRKSTDFIQRYIFPGGMLPPPGILVRLGQQRGLDMVVERVFGQDYATTLVHWREKFQEAWDKDEIEQLDEHFDLRFKRMWEFYMHYCEAGFISGNIDVRQMVFQKKVVEG